MTSLIAPAMQVVLSEGRVRLCSGERTLDLHPAWLRHRSVEPGQVEPSSRQRLLVATDVPGNLEVVEVALIDSELSLAFSDGHRCRLDLEGIERAVGWRDDPDEPPTATPWSAPLDTFPYVDWSRITFSSDDADPDAMLTALGAFFRYGYVVFRGTPTEPGTVARVADRLGYIVGHNFGWVFDVHATPTPTDLAYTAHALPAHTDQSYRRPVPGIQLLHCIVNEAPGGDSTLVDGLAAAEALRTTHPEWHAALRNTEVVWRYDIGSDTVVNRGHILEYDQHGRYRQILLNTKLDEPVVRPDVDLDAFYAGRRWLHEWANDPAHQVTFRLQPGDVMFMDNHRAMHGRTAFDAAAGRRHLQGCYIDHDGPDTLYRLASRRRRATLAR